MTKGTRKRILIAHGVNLDLLGTREPEIYGASTLASIEAELKAVNSNLAKVFSLDAAELTFYQTNHEGQFLEKISEGWDGAVINPGAWTHTSLALADRLAGLKLPFAEVHLSNLAKREAFRQHSYSAPHAVGVCFGFGAASYLCGLSGLYAWFAKQS
ncbi:type II 3-dehydroquinate dehydratase [Oligoflexus tunisiensis]|uniref:type II 3-dehydroquinate dehydratase n=1 Tax=Oligoflexus tunisiensis TaxID=708132 RepID=UPI000A3F5BF2|nr:type II 3-dehydroquinate dehydratase [Oligoflexus tunisiensis]